MQETSAPDSAEASGELRCHRSFPVGLLLVLPLVLAAVAYARVLDGEFVFDDTWAIVENSALKDLGGLLRDSRFFGYTRPVTDLTFALNYAFGGLEPWNFHLTNVAIHLAVVVLVFVFTRAVAQLAGAARASTVAVAVAGVFALHPIQTQAVSYVWQRAESLASGLYLVVVLLLLTAERCGRSWRGVVAWAGALLAFVLALGTKQMAMTAPMAYLLVGAAISGTPDGRAKLRSIRERLLLSAPLVALAIVHGIANVRSVAGRNDVGFDLPGLSAVEYLLTQTRVLVLYLRLLVWPEGQNAEWDVIPSRTLADPWVLAAGMLLGALVAGALYLLRWARRHPGADGAAARLGGLGLLWFFLVLSVTSSVLPLADVMFEHRLYVASWGIFVGPAAYLVDRVGERGRWLRAGAIAALLLVWGALATATYARNAVWETREAFARDGVAKSPGKPRVYVTLGHALREKGRHAEAIATYEAGLSRARAANDVRMEMQLLRNLGAAYEHSGRPAEAAKAFRAALDKGEHPDLLANLAIALLKLGDAGEANRLARRAVAVNPGNAHAVHTLAAVLYQQGDAAGALPLFERAAALDPDRAQFQVNLGRALADLGRKTEACLAWRRSLGARSDPALTALVSSLMKSGCP